MKEPMCKKGTANLRINAEPPKPTTFEDLGYVQIVRCKDCKHWENDGSSEFGICKICHSVGSSGSWFCADGEHK